MRWLGRARHQALGWTIYAALIGGLFSAVIMVTCRNPSQVRADLFHTEYFAIIALRAHERRFSRGS